MRNLILWIALIAACGPSGKEIALAKQARYQGDKLTLFNAAKTATEEKYKLEVSDETTLSFRTISRWYTPDGLVAAERNAERNQSNTGYNSLYPDRSVSVALIVKLLPQGENWVVDITPIMERYHAGSPQTEPLKPGDPSIPGWATGKVDQLYSTIHDALKQYEVKGVGGVAPAPAAPAAPAPAPSEPAATAPPPPPSPQ